MQTEFSLAQLADPDIAESDKILRACVHCGFCTATCPTYILLGDELDGPRGRIYLIKEMLEGGRGATAVVAKHLDRCLSCLSCMTTCPSGVHYMHLVDHARRVVRETYFRPLPDRLLRALLGLVLPRPGLFRKALRLASLARPLAPLLPGRLRAIMKIAPGHVPERSPIDRPQILPAEGERIKRVALLSGCVQTVLAPAINEATVRLLRRHGCEVVIAEGAGCCGSLSHHAGRREETELLVKANIAAWMREIEGEGLDAIIVNASGCGTTIKDYGFMLRADEEWAERAARVSALAKDVTEVMAELGLKPTARETGQVVAYHSACSMQHGQQLEGPPRALLAAAGFAVRNLPEGHICCGSAGTYNLLQPELATALRERKLANIAQVAPDMVATGNIGCITQLSVAGAPPVIHTVELLDWATGGPRPEGLPA